MMNYTRVVYLFGVWYKLSVCVSWTRSPLCGIMLAIIAISGWSESRRFLSCYYPTMQVNSQVRNLSPVQLSLMIWMWFFFFFLTLQNQSDLHLMRETFFEEKRKTLWPSVSETSRFDSLSLMGKASYATFFCRHCAPAGADSFSKCYEMKLHERQNPSDRIWSSLTETDPTSGSSGSPSLCWQMWLFAACRGKKTPFKSWVKGI